MSQKQRKFKRTYILQFEGRSRGFKDEPTFMENMIISGINALVGSYRSLFKTLKITFKEVDDGTN